MIVIPVAVRFAMRDSCPQIGLFRASHEKCSDDFSSKSLIALMATIDSAQVGLILDRALLYNFKAIGRQVRKDGLGDARTLLGRNPIVIRVRVAIALRVFDERCMDGVCDQ